MIRIVHVLLVAPLLAACAAKGEPGWLATSPDRDMDSVAMVHSDQLQALNGGMVSLVDMPADPASGQDRRVWMVIRHLERENLQMTSVQLNGAPMPQWQEVAEGRTRPMPWNGQNECVRCSMSPAIKEWLRYKRVLIVNVDPEQVQTLAKVGATLMLDRAGRTPIRVSLNRGLFHSLISGRGAALEGPSPRESPRQAE
ncbi:hypothetical protein [Yunchengibacter salinarum]|uniref:hypothetical protein n=1 Tax=Yunchengibacter salinarum TaxID=3133399 RepID=UPI0035B61E62